MLKLDNLFELKNVHSKLSLIHLLIITSDTITNCDKTVNHPETSNIHNRKIIHRDQTWMNLLMLHN